MSIHRSFIASGGIQAHRNVLTRAERLEKLKKEGRWDKEKGAFNLPKVRSIKGA